jgi:citryl-CoA lyase
LSSPRPSRNLGQYYRSGDWSDYWRTAVSYVSPHELLVRGYPIEEIVASLTYTETVYLTVRGELPTRAQARVLDAVLSSIPAHQWVASHLLAAAVTASASPASPVPAIASGILCIGSSTVSPQDGGQLAADGLKLINEGATPEEAAARVVQTTLDAGRLVPGLGHPNHKDFDPRAEALAMVARKEGTWGAACRFYELVRDRFAQLKSTRLPINIDGMIAAVLTDLSFTPSQMAGIAAIAIMPGIIACVDEEISDGVPLRVVPEALGSKYVGQPRRSIYDDPHRLAPSLDGARMTDPQEVAESEEPSK